MIIKEFYKTRLDGVNLYRTYSNEGFYIKQMATENLYSEAIDVENTPHVYEETNILIAPTEIDENEGEEIKEEELL